MSALPTLIRLSRQEGRNRQVLCCRGQPHLHEVHERAREIPDLDWNVCPLDLLHSPCMRAVRMLSKLATARTPLTGWPERFHPWAVSGLMMLTEGD